MDSIEEENKIDCIKEVDGNENVPTTSINLKNENVIETSSYEEIASNLSITEVAEVSATAKSFSFHSNESKEEILISLRCLICGKYQKNLKMLQFHMFHIHKTDESKKDEFTFNCPFCNSKFSTRKNRNEHMLMIHLTGKYKVLRCEFCNKRLSSVENKNLHIQKYHKAL